MNEKEMHTRLVASDLKSSGFKVRENSNGDLIVSLNRNLFASEVREALYNAGYDDAQFNATSLYGTVIVEVIC